MGCAIRPQTWRHLCHPRRDFQRDIRKITIAANSSAEKTADPTPYRGSRSLPDLFKRPPSLEQMDGRWLLQSDRILSGGDRERPSLRSRLRRPGGLLRAARMEQLPAAER